MTKSVHMGVSPSVRVENQIIDKKASKWESVLLYLVIFALLLPTAAQSLVGGLLGLSFLIPRSWRYIRWSEGLPESFIKLLKTLFIVWGLLLLASVLQSALVMDLAQMKPYLKLIGKQGVWGTIVIASMLFAQMKRRQSFLNPRIFLLYTLILILYSVLQRYLGIDWVHGIHAKLGENRLAYGVYRVSGWMDHPLTFSFNLMLVSLTTFAHALWLQKRGELKSSRIWFAQTFLLLFLLLLTDSRFPIALTIFLMVTVSAWDLPKLRKFLYGGLGFGLVAIIGIAFFVPHESLGRWGEFFDSNVALEQRFDRVIFWKINWQLFLQSPWLGTGLLSYDGRLLDTYLQAGYTGLERKYNAHNIYLQTLADGGLLAEMGLALLLAAVGRLAFVVNRQHHHLAIPLIFLATLGGGLVQNHLRDTEYLYALWTCIGLSLSWLIVQGNENESRPGSQLQDLQP